jgi:hypothetical protein
MRVKVGIRILPVDSTLIKPGGTLLFGLQTIIPVIGLSEEKTKP